MTKVIEGVVLKDYSIKVVPSYMKGCQFEAYRKIDIHNCNDSVHWSSTKHWMKASRGCIKV